MQMEGRKLGSSRESAVWENAHALSILRLLHFNLEKEKGYYGVPNIVRHKDEKCRKLTEQHRKKWILNRSLLSGEAVC